MKVKPLPQENMQHYIFRIGQLKDIGSIDESWNDIADIINKHYIKNELCYKKGKTYANIYSQVKNFYDAGVFNDYNQNELEELKKERIKIQTLNIEKNRINRNIARQELFYEQIGSAVSSLPLPSFSPLKEYQEIDSKNEYLLTLSDIHYGEKFELFRNEYSPEAFQERLEILCTDIISFIKKHNISKLHIVSLGDIIQGMIRISDLKINDSAVVKSVVEISRLIAQFLNELSEFSEIEYYHVTSSNHSQIRPLGTKANEIMDEDLEYVIGNYIKDLLKNNKRINVHLPEYGEDFIRIPISGYNIIAAHGHQFKKNLNTALTDLSYAIEEEVDYLILGHFHHTEIKHEYASCCHDKETILCPSFVGTDPYSKSIFKTGKGSVLILGFNDIYGHTETYKIMVE